MARTWTDDDVEAAVAESTERSGVPRKVTDPAVLARLAATAVKRADVKAAS